jgi:hypothetical protein
MPVRESGALRPLHPRACGSVEIYEELEAELNKAQLRGDLSVLAVGGCSGA